MDQSFAANLSRAIVVSTPAAFTIVGAVALAAPIRLFEGAVPTPLLPLTAVFYWSLYKPEYMPALFVFFVGVLQDLVNGGAVGLWSLGYLSVHAVVLWQREFFLGRSFSALWVGFAFTACLAATVVWLGASLYYVRFMPVGEFAVQIGATILVYPLFHRLFESVRRRDRQEY